MEYNRDSERADGRKHRRWSAMETFDLVQAELKYEGTDINQHLSRLFPERTFDMIKSKRRLAEYKALRDRLQAEREEAAPDLDLDSPPPVSPTPSSPVEDEVFYASPAPAPSTSGGRARSPRNAASLADELLTGHTTRVTRSQRWTGSIHTATQSGPKTPDKTPDTAHSPSSSPSSPEDDGTQPPSSAPSEPTPPPPAASPPLRDADAVRDYIWEILSHPSIPHDVVPIVNTALGQHAMPEQKKEAVEAILTTVRDTINPSAPPRPGRPMEDRSRFRRPQQYRLAQQLWAKDRAQLAEGIIDGTLFTTPSSVPTMDVLEEAYQGIFGAESVPDDNPITDPKTHNVAIYQPVLVEELTTALARKQSNARGPDGLTISDLRRAPPHLLALLYNTILYTSSIPDSWRANRTILISKGGADPAHVDSWRPITISSAGLRTLNKILSRRFTQLPLLGEQRGFRDVDGTLANTTILQAIIKHYRANTIPHSISTLDLRKAFDTVSHRSIYRSLRRFCVEPKIIELVKDNYTNIFTTLTAAGRTSRPIDINRGVKQGDPLSPILFNMVVDEFLCALKAREAGLSINGVRIPALAYADDMVLLAETGRDMQKVVREAEHHLERRGMTLNATKSTNFTCRLVPKKKKLYVSTDTRIYIAGGFLKPITVVDQFKYLGYSFSVTGAKETSLTELPEQLRRIERGPLKPHQKLLLLKYYLCPRYNYILQNPDISLKTLRNADRLLRASVKKILHLPAQTPNAALYCPIKQGGLGITSFQHRIPGILLSRIRKIQRVQDPQLHTAIGTEYYQHLCTRLSRWLQECGESARSVAGYWAARLEASTSGGGLWQVSGNPSSSGWLETPPVFWSGQDFVKAVLLRFNLLPTHGGVHNRSGQTRCRAGCARRETVCHVLQGCPVTHYNRIRRHDRVASLLHKYATNSGWTAEAEPRVRDANGVLYKPDLLLRKDRTIVIAEVGIHWEGPDLLQAAYNAKLRSYSGEGFTTALRQRYPAEDITVLPFIVGARGGWCPNNDQLMRRLSLGKREASTIIQDTLKGGWIAHAAFSSMVWARDRPAG